MTTLRFSLFLSELLSRRSSLSSELCVVVSLVLLLAIDDILSLSSRQLSFNAKDRTLFFFPSVVRTSLDENEDPLYEHFDNIASAMSRKESPKVAKMLQNALEYS